MMFGPGAAPIVVLSKLKVTFRECRLLFGSSHVWAVFLTMSSILIIAGQNTKRDTGRKVQKENIQAGKVSILFAWQQIFCLIRHSLLPARPRTCGFWRKYKFSSRKCRECYKFSQFKIHFCSCVITSFAFKMKYIWHWKEKEKMWMERTWRNSLLEIY